ncbi:MAG: PD-(D/E)XK nuclease family protein [Clostridia bacterium]|nr:PD-(D/E)XK nuclease family protein [Clostridia bacterium]
MTYRIIGRAGSGKTHYMISCLKELQSAGVDCLFLVPEQQSLTAELAIERAGGADFNTEVLNFERLPNRVFREIGSLVTDTVDGAGKSILMARAWNAVKEDLCLFRRLSRGVLGDLCSTVSVLKRLCVSPSYLLEIGKRLEKERGAEEGLIHKIKDTALIYGKYEELLGDKRCDDDDPLTRLAVTEGAAEFFRGKAVFLDGIYTYTPQQYRIIELMAKNAAYLYVSFTMDEDESGIFDGVAGCARKIKELSGGNTKDVFLSTNHRVQSKALAYGEERLWAGGKPFEGDCSDVDAVCCTDRYEEARYAAGVILSLCEKGLRFNEIAIALRSPDAYQGILDTALASYNVPFYFGTKDSAATKPLTAAVLALLEMAAGRLPLSAVKKYLKTTFSVLSDEDADMLIRYAERWNIRGKAWISDKDWLMNPNGYKAEISAEEEALLTRVNESRRAFALSVGPVIEELRSADLTVEKAIRLIYDHLLQCDAEKKLAAAAERLTNTGDADGGIKTAALWEVMVDTFDRLYTLAGTEATTAEELLLLMEAQFSVTDIGAIPSYTDAVTIGDARLMRADGIKAMIILGLNEGEFPALPVKSGVFSAADSERLEDFELSLLPDTDKAVNEERFFFYNCASAPSQYLFVSHVSAGESRRSPLFAAVCAMFGKGEGRIYGEDERDRLFCKKAALTTLPYIKNAALKGAVRRVLSADPEARAILEEAPPLQDERAYAGEEHLEVMYLSYSRVDCYNNCGFAYLMKYKLALKPDTRLKFNSMDSGTYLHHLMEMYLKKRMETGKYVSADRSETVSEINALSEAYIKAVMPAPPGKRLKKLFERLNNAAVFMCEDINTEFGNSDFEPRGFEVRIGSGAEVAPPKLISTGGIDVRLSGSIDRLDTAEIDGKRYVRVVDYKSSPHTVSKKDIENGEGLQMLSYLYAYIDAAEDDPVPAGVLYRSFALPEDGKLPSQKGMISSDAKVLDAMGPGFKQMRNKLTEEEFASLKEDVYSHVTNTADLMAAGVMDVKPFKKEKTDCENCDYGEACRMKKKTAKFW